MKRLVLIISVFFCIVFLFNSCGKENRWDCFKSTGKETTITRELPFFDKVLVYDKLDVILIEDSVFKVKLEGGENVLKLIYTNVQNGELMITNDNSCNVVRSYKRKIKLYVSAPKFKELTHRGVGELRTQGTLHSDSIIYRVLNSGNMFLNVDNNLINGVMNGMGDINIIGKTEKHILNANGECHVNCGQLETKFSDYVLKISGPTYLNVNNELNVVIRNIGNVYYNGNPTIINKEITGSGKLISGF